MPNLHVTCPCCGEDYDAPPEGAHRLLVGDSTQAEDVTRLMQTEQASACITDPPYSVHYDQSHVVRGGNAAVHQPYHESDDPIDILDFLHLLPCDVLVMSYPVDRHFFALADALRRAKMDVRKELVWVKDTFSFWMGAKYQQRHEPILVCARVGKPVHADVPANESTVFEIPRPKAHDLHPTAKPLSLWVKLVTYHAPPSTVVYEPFGGSGTTLIAAERLDRQCRAIEIDPRYADVILHRYEAETDRDAVLLQRVEDAQEVPDAS